MNNKPLFFDFVVTFMCLHSNQVFAQHRFEVPYDSNQRYLALRSVELQFYPLEADRKEKAQIRADIVCQGLAKDQSYRAAHFTTARNIWFTFSGFKFYNFSRGDQPTEIYDYPRCWSCNSDLTWRLSRPGLYGHYTHYFTSIVCTNRIPNRSYY